ncbi:MAG: hypothetical protein H7176_06310 [Bdellovibrionales bacterium]|nr:hypothetical protein [Massilia sp.]
MAPADSIVTQKNPALAEAIRDAHLVLAHAARAGVALHAEVIQTIVDIGALAATEQIDNAQEAKFWGVWNQLSKAVSPLTIASLRANTVVDPGGRFFGPRTQARKAELRYRTYAIVALIVLLITQAYWLFGNAVRVEIARASKELVEMTAKAQAFGAQARGAVADAVTSSRFNAESEAFDVLRKAIFTRQAANRELLEIWTKPWAWLVPINSPHDLVDSQDAARLQTALTILDIFQRYVLALLYGFLGACA